MLNVCLSPKPTNYEAVYFHFWDISDFMLDFDVIPLRVALCCASLCYYAELFVADTLRRLVYRPRSTTGRRSLGQRTMWQRRS
jgi:hypothetical protein